MACEATRPAPIGMMWECDGTNLVTLMKAYGTHPPAVIRADLIPYLGYPESTLLPGEPFPGGDHLHIVVTTLLPIPLKDAS